MGNAITLITSIIKKLWGVPGALLVAIITIGGLVQSGEYFVKYFPSLTTWVHTNQIVLLTILVVVLGCSDVVLGWYCSGLHKKQRLIDHSDQVNKVVLFLSPSSGGGGNFYQEHFSHLVKSAARAANPRLNIHITLVCPPKDFANESPECLLDITNNYPASLAGIFMIPAYPDKEANRNGIIKFKEKFPALVLLDVYPLIDPGQLPKTINFIGGNENEGGALAASLAKRWLTKCNKNGMCRILILKGRSTLWEMQRVNSFKDSLKEIDSHGNSSNICFEESEDLHYELKRASKEIEARINRGQNPATFDLIFACNDEMAIGALEVLQNLVFKKLVTPKSLPKIIGYDGTPEMKRLIKSNNPLLLGTVDVDIEEQAERAINTMTSLLNDPESPQPELNLLQPTLFINSSLLT
jgi:ABC-type sugar transport system substrate-binding protein